jgi:hypothetical protein
MGSLRLKRPIRLSRGREVWAALGSGAAVEARDREAFILVDNAARSRDPR